MNKIIDLLGKTVKFVHTENDHFFEEQGKIRRNFKHTRKTSHNFRKQRMFSFRIIT